MPTKMFDGDGTAVEAIRLARPGVIAAYPITPQSPIAEKLSSEIVDKRIDAEYVRVESEHSAQSVVVGAALTGCRVATATASVGLALMHEVCGVTAGLRLPVVMPVVNRSLVSPWSLWCDHSDSMAERDTGWLQFYASSCQEILDLMLCSYRICEHPEVLTPAMVCLDGFFLSHSMQRVDTPTDDEAWDFVGPYVRRNLYIDTKDVMFVDDLCPTSMNEEMKYQQQMGFVKAKEVVPQVFEEYNKRFGRKLSVVEPYKLDDAEVAVVTIGSMSGTGKYAVNKLREKGIKAGLLKITMFRPFPAEEIREALKNVPYIGVIDRSAGLGGAQGPVCSEVMAALLGTDAKVFGFNGGIAGRDISDQSFYSIFKDLLAVKNGEKKDVKHWFDVRDDAMTLGEVKVPC